MKLIGIVDADDFKEKVLEQREILKSESIGVQRPAEKSADESAIIDVLKEIKALLEEIKNK
jgi:putative membrane protein